MMTVFARKKPVIIECMKFDGVNFDEVGKFCGDAVEFPFNTERGCAEVIIKTLEGNHHASTGDIIIKGVNGEFYPCKPDIFEKTYEFVDPLEAKRSRQISFTRSLGHLTASKKVNASTVPAGMEKECSQFFKRATPMESRATSRLPKRGDSMRAAFSAANLICS